MNLIVRGMLNHIVIELLWFIIFLSTTIEADPPNILLASILVVKRVAYDLPIVIALPLWQLHRLARQIVRTIAQKLNLAVRHKRMANVVQPMNRSVVCLNQNGRLKRRLLDASVPSPSCLHGVWFFNGHAMQTTASRTLKKHVAIFCLFAFDCHNAHHEQMFVPKLPTTVFVMEGLPAATR